MAKQKSMMEYMRERNSMQLKGGPDDPPKKSGPGDPPKNMFAVPKIDAKVETSKGLGDNSRLVAKKEGKKTVYPAPKGNAAKDADSKAIDDTIKEIDALRKENKIKGTDAVGMKKQLLGEGGYKDRYTPSLRSKISSFITKKKYMDGSRSGAPKGSAKKAQCKSGDCSKPLSESF
jgi:hypothetical protein